MMEVLQYLAMSLKWRIQEQKVKELTDVVIYTQL